MISLNSTNQVPLMSYGPPYELVLTPLCTRNLEITKTQEVLYSLLHHRIYMVLCLAELKYAGSIW